MKRIIILLTLLIAVHSAQAQSVLIPEGDFENWTTVNYDDLNLWYTSNSYTVPGYGVVTTSKIAGFGSTHGVRVESKHSGLDTFAGYVSNSNGDIEMGEGGVPFTFKAEFFNGTYRYNVASGDTAFILIIFKKNGSIISNNLYPITGSQLTQTPFSLPVATMAQAPDSIIIAAVSSNVINADAVTGSWLELDVLGFADQTLSVPAPNGDFENWIPKTQDNLIGWYVDGDGEVSKTTDKHTGSFAAKLVSRDDGFGYVEESVIVLGDGTQPYGMPFTRKVDTLTGYYKYTTPGSDNGYIEVRLTDANGTQIGPSGTFVFTPKSTYTYFEIPLSVSTTPAGLSLGITSSQNGNTPVDQSTLYIDNLRLKNIPNSISRIVNNKKDLSVYPNPARNTLYIKAKTSNIKDVELKVYDVSGKLMYDQRHDLSKKNITLPVNKYPSGIYHYEIVSGNSISTGQFIKE